MLCERGGRRGSLPHPTTTHTKRVDRSSRFQKMGRMKSDNRRVRFGTAYYPDHWPQTDWARDLDRIKATGMDSIRFGEFSWSWFEPKPGKFEWGEYDRFADLAEQCGIKLVLCTPTATPPPWFLKKFPDCRLVDSEGRPCTNHRHYWCWN